MEYTHSSELTNKVLKCGDRIRFVSPTFNLFYQFNNRYLSGINCSNSKIFTELKIINPYIFVEKYYRYKYEGGKIENGGCPECKSNDYEALTRLVIALMKICEKLKDEENKQI